MSAHLDAALEELDRGLHDSGDHTTCDPDICFNAKMSYWRQNGVVGINTKPMLTREVSTYDMTKRQWLEQNVGIDKIKSGAAVRKDTAWI
jgi:hypothetical protein